MVVTHILLFLFFFFRSLTEAVSILCSTNENLHLRKIEHKNQSRYCMGKSPLDLTKPKSLVTNKKIILATLIERSGPNLYFKRVN